jgi:NADH:ubiquinone oxidoreductase subunit 3 (subunit A)
MSGENQNSSMIMDLENLRREYSNLLISYKAAVAEYIAYLNLMSENPCQSYTANSTGIDQACYNYIWKRSGCGSGTIQPGPNANSSWAQGQTLNGLIYDSWLWATETDEEHREGCYGSSTSYNTSTSPDYNINKPPLVTIQGQAYNGTGSAGESNATTLQDCVAACSSSQTCTGATFVSNKCLIRTGESDLASSTEDSYAIIPKGKQLLLNMENINQQLLSVNQELLEKIKETEPTYDRIDEETNVKNDELIRSYEDLLEERRNIELLLKEYETLENTETQNQIKISQNYYTYILLIIFAIIIIVLLYVVFGSTNSTKPNIQRGGELSNNTYYIVFGLILVIALINYFTK